MGFRRSVLDGRCGGTNIGKSPLLFFISGILLILVQLLLLATLKGSRYLASRGDRRASSALVLPIYYLTVLYMVGFGILVGILHIVGELSDSVQAITLKWFIYRVCAESLSIFLMHSGVGYYPLMRSLAIGSSWAFISSFVPFVVFTIFGLQAYLITSITLLVILFCFYFTIAFAPAKYINRRPAIFPYAYFYCCGIMLLLGAHIFILEDYEHSGCIVQAIEAFGDLIQPLVMYKAMYDDSLFWQGLYTNTQSNINEPLVGMWELGRETIQVVGSSLQDLKSHFVPIIPFGTLQIDSSRYFSGGSARVYKGQFRDEEVAVKILFCIELTPQRVVSFCSEVGLLHSLQHPNIVICHGVSVMPPAICMVTEFCHQGSLYDFLHSSGYIIRESVVSAGRLTSQFRGSTSRASHASTSSASSVHEGLLINLFSSPNGVPTTGTRVLSSDNAEKKQDKTSTNSTLKTPMLHSVANGRSFSSDVESNREPSALTMRASTGQLDINDKYDEQELKELKNRIQSWKLVPPSNSSQISGLLPPDMEMEGISSGLHSQQSDDYGGESSCQNLADVNMAYESLGRFTQKLKSAASLMQSSFMRFGLGPSDVTPTVQPSLLVKSSRSSISGSVSSSTKAGELLAGCGDSHPESLGLSMPMDLKLKMARDCCAGVAFLHSKGLMHCDIKSLNFLVTRDFTVKLADLGEARPSHGVDKIDASVLPKNINWTAPEILINDSNQINELSDVWSLTMVIAEILTGEIPFDTAATRAMTVEKFVASIADGARPAFPTSTPEWMRTIVISGWQYHTEKRSSAEFMKKCLEMNIKRLVEEGAMTTKRSLGTTEI